MAPILKRKLPAKRAFYGMAGSPLNPPVVLPFEQRVENLCSASTLDCNPQLISTLFQDRPEPDIAPAVSALIADEKYLPLALVKRRKRGRPATGGKSSSERGKIFRARKEVRRAEMQADNERNIRMIEERRRQREEREAQLKEDLATGKITPEEFVALADAAAAKESMAQYDVDMQGEAEREAKYQKALKEGRVGENWGEYMPEAQAGRGLLITGGWSTAKVDLVDGIRRADDKVFGEADGRLNEGKARHVTPEGTDIRSLEKGEDHEFFEQCYERNEVVVKDEDGNIEVADDNDTTPAEALQENAQKTSRDPELRSVNDAPQRTSCFPIRGLDYTRAEARKHAGPVTVEQAPICCVPDCGGRAFTVHPESRHLPLKLAKFLCAYHEAEVHWSRILNDPVRYLRGAAKWLRQDPEAGESCAFLELLVAEIEFSFAVKTTW